MTIKDFFMLSLSITLLFLCCAGFFCLWKHEQEKQQILKNEQIMRQKLLERKQSDDVFYTSEFVKMFNVYDSDTNKIFTYKLWDEKFRDLEDKMVQDGYTHAEALAIRNYARSLSGTQVKN